MSRVPDYILKGIGRINDFLPLPIVAETLSGSIRKKIPFGIVEAYDLYETVIHGTRFLLCGTAENEDSIPPHILERHRDVLQKQTGLVPIFIFSKLASYLLPRYAKRNINLVVAGRQLFLPTIFLIADKVNASSQIPDAPPIAFQLIVILELEKRAVGGKTMREASGLLNISYASVNRCVRWMRARGFLKPTEGKEQRIEFACHGKSLWDKAQPYLVNPIDFVVHTSEPGLSDKALVSGQNALAEYTMLNEGPPMFAISKGFYNEMKQRRGGWNQLGGEFGFEVWKYDPGMLGNNGVVDKLSLFLIMKDCDDERVQIELENMMNEIAW